MIELLVTIGILVLVMGMIMPNFNFFQNAEYEPVYNFGLYGNDFPGDLQFDPYKELVVFINLEHSIFNINYSLNIQPFFLYNLNQPIFFKESF